MVGIEELGSVGFSLRGVIAPSRGRSSCARLGSSFSVLGPHFASFNGCFLVVLFSSFDAFWWRLNDPLLLLVLALCIFLTSSIADVPLLSTPHPQLVLSTFFSHKPPDKAALQPRRSLLRLFTSGPGAPCPPPLPCDLIAALVPSGSYS